MNNGKCSFNDKIHFSFSAKRHMGSMYGMLTVIPQETETSSTDQHESGKIQMPFLPRGALHRHAKREEIMWHDTL